jgi:hypothetical protein
VKSLSESYVERRKRVLSPLAERLAMHLDKLFEDFGRIDRISVRAKSVDRFVAKAEKQENGKRTAGN